MAARKNDEITSEENAHIEPDSQADLQPETDQPADEQLRNLTAESRDVPKAFPFPGDTQSQGTRNPAPQFVSAGVANDVEIYGSAIDPATGNRITREDLEAWGYTKSEPPAPAE